MFSLPALSSLNTVPQFIDVVPFGIGPVWVHTNEQGVNRNSVGGEAVLDFMFWPSRKHRFGWYLEPGAYSGDVNGPFRQIVNKVGALATLAFVMMPGLFT